VGQLLTDNKRSYGAKKAKLSYLQCI